MNAKLNLVEITEIEWKQGKSFSYATNFHDLF